MGMPALQDNLVPISDFNRGRASAAFSRVSDGNPVVVIKRNVVSYVIVTPDDYRRWVEVEEELERMRGRGA